MLHWNLKFQDLNTVKKYTIEILFAISMLILFENLKENEENFPADILLYLVGFDIDIRRKS